MKIYAINGSPRKKWNTAMMLERFAEGVKSVDPTAEVKTINVYDYNFTGCRSCFGCKLKATPQGQCVIKDDIHDILADVRQSDGVVFGSPVYFLDLSGQLRCFLERLLYPGATEKPIPSAFIYTMNATEEMMEQIFRRNLDSSAGFVEGNFRSKPEQIFSFDTYQRPLENEHLYRPSRHSNEDKKLRRETEFPKDLESAYEAGVRMAKKILNTAE
jgi:multimeric flavodoxin WrbA